MYDILYCSYESKPSVLFDRTVQWVRLLVWRDSLWCIFLVPRVARCVKWNERFTNISLVMFNVALKYTLTYRVDFQYLLSYATSLAEFIPLPVSDIFNQLLKILKLPVFFRRKCKV
jgi:hypothetical protein